MLGKGSKLYSIFLNKCPRCHQGDFFEQNHFFSLRGFSKMHSHCKVCGLSFEQEPGYYFGAMYVSYAINVAVMVAVWVAALVLFDDDKNFWWIVLASVVIGLGLTPLTFRLSRLGWINFFIRYKPIIEIKK